MKYWRMTFRSGPTGYEMWPLCFRNGVAALANRKLGHLDLSKQPYGTPRDVWAQLPSNQKAGLRRVGYEIAKDDIICVKQGPRIVGCGVVLGPYVWRLSKEIVDDQGWLWDHQVPVQWESDFAPIRLLLGAERMTVLELNEVHLHVLREAEALERENLQSVEAQEGEIVSAYVSFRRRNRALVEVKRAACASKPCEVCGFSFRARYGGSLDELQEVHHRNPMAEREGVTVTTLDDLVWLCPNCHRALHSTRPAMAVDVLASMIRRADQGVARCARPYARVLRP